MLRYLVNRHLYTPELESPLLRYYDHTGHYYCLPCMLLGSNTNNQRIGLQA